jgi:ankyrin repeat protein
MGRPSDRDESTEAGGEIGRSRARRGRLFEQDIVGRTPLFYAAEQGRIDQVREMIFSLGGTGLSPPRLALIAIEDVAGLTAADVAEQHGHDEIAQLLRSEQGRMEFFE